MTDMQGGISLCMIVKDEQTFLGDCLQSVKDIVKEIILVDTGSTDDTVSIAERFGAKVYHYLWDNSFSNARNFAIEKAGHEWILLLDADERLFAEDRQKLLDFINTTTQDGAHFTVYNYVGDTGFTQYSLHNAFRLLKNNGMYRFHGSIHEQIIRADGQPVVNRFALTDIRIHHLGYLNSVIKQKDKRNRNIPLLTEELSKDPNNAFMLFNLGNEYMIMKDYPKALELYEKSHALYDKQDAYGPFLFFRTAICYYSLEMHQKALDILREGLSAYPGCTDMEFLKGRVYMEWQRDVLAIECFQKAIAMGPPHPTLRISDNCSTTRPLCALALLYERQHDYEKAAMHYAKALQADNKLYSTLYSIAGVSVKIGLSPSQIEQRFMSFFGDLSHIPNRMMLADVLLSQRICGPCKAHLELLDSAQEYEGERAMLWGKYYFYEKQYTQAIAYLIKAVRTGEPPRILPAALRDGTILLLATHLILGIKQPKDTANILSDMVKAFGSLGERLTKQIFAVLDGSEESLLEGDDSKNTLSLFTALLQIILWSGEYDLFEKLLYVYNHINDPGVMLSLAALYQENGFFKLASETVLRSIKELNVLDPVGAQILANALLEEKAVG